MIFWNKARKCDTRSTRGACDTYQVWSSLAVVQDKPARLIIRLLFDSVFVKLNQNINKYWDSNAIKLKYSIYSDTFPIIRGLTIGPNFLLICQYASFMVCKFISHIQNWTGLRFCDSGRPQVYRLRVSTSTDVLVLLIFFTLINCFI